ncbi:MAG TPA: glutamate-5-semialdehyde dehydrogenase, partial [Thermoleophilia bacterium]|nr:glutamate-5-semialdehyde dehydrogenase [Thermoleophilia bacterium]
MSEDAHTQAVSSESPTLEEIGRRTRAAALELASLPEGARNEAIEAIAVALEESASEILAANLADREAAEADGISPSLYSRLKLDEVKLRGEIAGVRDVERLPDPVGARQIHRRLDDRLVLERISVPVGVLGVIFEARPDAVIQISSLAVKSGNAAILKGGREAVRSCQAIVTAVRRGLERTRVSPEAIQLLTTREETVGLLKLDRYVDLIIPRGSNSFVRFVQDNTHIPVLGHAEGICHLYIDATADIAKAVPIAVDSKVQYPAACNASETMLVHQNAAAAFLPEAGAALRAAGVTLRADEQSRDILTAAAIGGVEPATEDDWRTEYSALVLAVRIVDSLDEAIAHVNTYGSRHTDSIVTEDPAAAETFLARVDSAGVFHNCSTRFSDGFRYGFGA